MAETILTWKPVVIAIVGGILPSLVWLWFWLKEDRKSPEPTGLIALSFFAGMAIVYFVLPVQKFVVASISPIMDMADALALKFSLLPPDEQTVRITLWAFIEEFAKYATVFLIAFKSKFFDEPMDAVIYLITAALGFAAMENTLYIFKDLAHGGALEVLGNGNMRFIGATIVHIVSSSFVGIAIAFSFYARRYIKFIAATMGIFIASLLHAYFNLSIIESDGTIKTLLVFSQFWAAIIGIIMLLALVKRIPKTHNPN
ncbi:MAG: PrsW family intramembrane metalloprotease [Candidatus Yonathbacteria bacterium]|nr:PrsW family intramembrane metalloprotease [Candidatus Yonathbacteria bacterium]